MLTRTTNALRIKNTYRRNKQGIIEPTGHVEREIVSWIFLREKKDGSHRMILNLKSLSQFMNKLHFKMDTLHTITKLVEKDCFMAAIDLKDAYYSVTMAPEDRKYLKFIWRGKPYQFTCPIYLPTIHKTSQTCPF